MTTEDPEGQQDQEEASPSAAPGKLELVRAFVNTLDVEAGTDQLRTPGEAQAWLVERGHRCSRPPSGSDLRGLLEFREALRDAASERGTPAGAAALGVLDGIAERHPVTVRPSAGPLPFAAAGSGVDGFVERLLGILAAATIDGTWERLKACENDRCRWLFYDHSRNRSRTWCSMDVCGARSKMRTYRARRRLTAGEHPERPSA
jgi:predicted RNA-binding Zn ribbon-like protein